MINIVGRKEEICHEQLNPLKNLLKHYVLVLLKEDLDKYNPLFFSKYRAYSHCYAIVDNFEGEVEIDTSNSNWTIVRGQGNIDFSSDTFDEDEWDEDEE